MRLYRGTRRATIHHIPVNPGAFGFPVGPSVRAYIGRRTSDSQILRVKPSLDPASSWPWSDLVQIRVSRILKQTNLNKSSLCRVCLAFIKYSWWRLCQYCETQNLWRIFFYSYYIPYYSIYSVDSVCWTFCQIIICIKVFINTGSYFSGFEVSVDGNLIEFQWINAPRYYEHWRMNYFQTSWREIQANEANRKLIMQGKHTCFKDSLRIPAIFPMRTARCGHVRSTSWVKYGPGHHVRRVYCSRREARIFELNCGLTLRASRWFAMGLAVSPCSEILSHISPRKKKALILACSPHMVATVRDVGPLGMSAKLRTYCIRRHARRQNISIKSKGMHRWCERRPRASPIRATRLVWPWSEALALPTAEIVEGSPRGSQQRD
jgi:hypothetical protein